MFTMDKYTMVEKMAESLFSHKFPLILRVNFAAMDFSSVSPNSSYRLITVLIENENLYHNYVCWPPGPPGGCYSMVIEVVLI